MRSQKRTSFFSLGRKWVFTLALFLLVFAAASIVKVQAASVITGWLWGGSEDASIGGVTGDSNASCKTYPAPAGCIDGNESGIYWVSMSSKNCDVNGNGTYQGAVEGAPAGCPTLGAVIPYGVNIPSPTDGGSLSGHAWSPGVGYISFDETELGGCPSGACKAYRTGNKIQGWARFMEIASAGANSGGWNGWISLEGNTSDGNSYGVTINDDNTLSGYGWSGVVSGSGAELGWIDFAGAKVEEVCTLKFEPATKTINENSSDKVTLMEDSAGSNCKCNNVKVEITNPSIVASISPPTTFPGFSAASKDSADVSISIKSVDSDTSFNGVVKATSDNCGEVSLNLYVRNIPACTLTCPSEIVVTTGQTKSVKSEIGITGEAGCTASAINCSESGTDTNGNIDVTSGCDVSETGNLRYGSSELRASGGTGSCTSPITVKGPGWVETSP